MNAISNYTGITHGDKGNLFNFNLNPKFTQNNQGASKNKSK